jgi:WD40 repeat protein
MKRSILFAQLLLVFQVSLSQTGQPEPPKINSAFFSPDGMKLITASSDNVARVWDIQTGKYLVQYQGHSDQVLKAIFSPDGKKVLTISNDKTLKLWNSENDQQQFSIPIGHGYLESDLISMQFSKDAKKILTAVGGYPGSLKVWDAGNGNLLADLIETCWLI